MAKFVLKNAYASINSVNLSSYIKSITIDYSVQENAQTSMGDTFENFIAGTLKIAAVDIEFYQDFASSQVDQTLNGLLGASTAVEFRAVNTTVSATNPKWSGNMQLVKYTPVGGSVGDTAMAPARFVCVDGTGLVRGTA